MNLRSLGRWAVTVLSLSAVGVAPMLFNPAAPAAVATRRR